MIVASRVAAALIGAMFIVRSVLKNKELLSIGGTIPGELRWTRQPALTCRSVAIKSVRSKMMLTP
ncbi:MAG TPA: hypothetical protein VEJ22_04900 [Nitrospirota bacterium]|nr:hypothetical protein [Nitrospirota bacterium]